MEFKEKIPETQYNHPEIAEIERGMFSLCDKMKDELLAGEYDYIISDDKTGRIPSLIFKNVIENLNSNKKIDILGIAAGRKLARIFDLASGGGEEADLANNLFDQIQDVLKRKVKPKVGNKALIVTEYIHSGDSMKNLKWLIERSGIRFDIATLNSFSVKELEEPDVKVFTSSIRVDSENPFFKLSEEYAGIETDEEHLPFPVLYSKIMQKKGINFTIAQEKELSESFQLTAEEKAAYSQADEESKRAINAKRDERWSNIFNKHYGINKNVLPEYLSELRKKINRTREDIKTMAKKISSKLKEEA